MAEINGGRIAARQLRAAGIDTVFGVALVPLGVEVLAFFGLEKLGPDGQ